MNRMNLKKVLYIMCGLYAAGFVLIMVGALLAGISRLAGILMVTLGILVMIVAIVFHGIKSRCPHCGEWLRIGGGKYCPHCGHHLVDLE